MNQKSYRWEKVVCEKVKEFIEANEVELRCGDIPSEEEVIKFVDFKLEKGDLEDIMEWFKTDLHSNSLIELAIYSKFSTLLESFVQQIENQQKWDDLAEWLA